MSPEIFGPPNTRFIDALLSAVLCGLGLHLLFNKFERQYLHLLKFALLFSPLAPLYIILPHYRGIALNVVLTAYGTTYATLLMSLIIYRLSPIHPLWKYPGPVLAKCTKFWGVYHSSTGCIHHTLSDLHRYYGSVVRTGPNELSFCDVDAIQPILGADGMGKGPVWDGRHSPKRKEVSLIGIRDTTEHLQRRKVWNRAFNISRIKKYEPILRVRVDQLVDALQDLSKTNAQVDLAEWMSSFAYDFMGDMAFGGFFELMRDGDVDGLWKLMEAGIRVNAYSQHIPWAAPVLYALPGLGKASARLIDFVTAMANKRIQRGMAFTGEDLSSHLLDEVSPSPKPMPLSVYSSDALLAVVAGSDTTATALSNMFFYILSDKTFFEELRNEIDANFPIKEGRIPADDSSKLSSMPYLNAVINEALRLQPPVPSGLQRAPDVGTGGKLIGSTFVPEGTGVYLPPYVIHRDERYFYPNPNAFWPERWLSGDPNTKTNQAAYIPYSVGPMNCAGKLLAQLELRVVLATLVQRFDMELKPQWNPLEWETNLQDFFVSTKGTLPVIIKPRVL
ncbi:hypothetical protein CVT25_004010 [Psilocybe cyanescens]|uniref:Cytochrome P450 n=1 Tax=Psilocybe cyanescens TaxID=93625 RepID=A0A409WXS4_PSICY|nr:hypothetical protein CVT25_004010 [Psilocybe cyanescens]